MPPVQSQKRKNTSNRVQHQNISVPNKNHNYTIHTFSGIGIT